MVHPVPLATFRSVLCAEGILGLSVSHVECSAEERALIGIPEGLIRNSTGIEDPDDLIADLEQALGAETSVQASA